MSGGCFVCDKLGGRAGIPGATVHRDPLVHAGHLGGSVDDAGLYEGHLVVEPVRHAVGWHAVTTAEAERMGRVIRACAGALWGSYHPERVYTFVLGHGADHLHVHVVPRHRGAPEDLRGAEVTKWTDAPRVDATGAVAVAERLSPLVAAEVGS